MNGSRQQQRDGSIFAITIDPQLCNGCRTCELACSFHHSGSMSPELASVHLRRPRSLRRLPM